MSASYDSNLDDLFRALECAKTLLSKIGTKIYSNVQNITPDYLRARFVYRDNISGYRLRNTENKLVDGFGGKRALGVLRKSELCLNRSKFRIQFCLGALNNVLDVVTSARDLKDGSFT